MSHEAHSIPAPAKSPVVAFLLWFFLGGFGAHRFYFGKIGSGFGMLGLFVGSTVLLTVLVGAIGFLALFVWWVVDAFQINGWCREQTGIAGSIGVTDQSRAAA